jgi:hypothetical protein
MMNLQDLVFGDDNTTATGRHSFLRFRMIANGLAVSSLQVALVPLDCRMFAGLRLPKE